jgi:hypothetical protein
MTCFSEHISDTKKLINALSPRQKNWAREIKVTQIEMEKAKLSLFKDGMILYIGNLDCTKNCHN